MLINVHAAKFLFSHLVFLRPFLDQLCCLLKIVGVGGIELEIGGQLQEHLTNHLRGHLHGGQQLFVHLPESHK